MQGTIRVAITQLGARHLMKFLDRFFLTYPNIDIDFLINNGRVDILQEGCDLWLTVNTGKLNSRGLKRRVLIRQPNIVVASPGYLAKFGNPTSPEDLENHTCIALVNRSPIWVFRSALGSKTVQMRHKITVSSGESLINASIADLGLIYGMALYFSEEIASGRLVRVLPHYEIGSSRLSAIYPSNRYTPKRINAFIDYVQEVTRAEASSFT